jgi:hypothetical protein
VADAADRLLLDRVMPVQGSGPESIPRHRLLGGVSFYLG